MSVCLGGLVCKHQHGIEVNFHRLKFGITGDLRVVRSISLRNTNRMSNEDSNADLYNVPLSSDSDLGELTDNNKAVVEQENTKNDNYTGSHSLDPDINPDEEEEKQRLISQVLELQNTLDDLSSRVDTVKEENLKLKSENQVLGQYIENLMAASSVFQSTSPKSKKK